MFIFRERIAWEQSYVNSEAKFLITEWEKSDRECFGVEMVHRNQIKATLLKTKFFSSFQQMRKWKICYNSIHLLAPRYCYEDYMWIVLMHWEIISNIINLPESQHCASLSSSDPSWTLADRQNSLYHRWSPGDVPCSQYQNAGHPKHF